MNYQTFLDDKAQSPAGTGLKPKHLPRALFDFQSSLVEWALWRGRSGVFADCGLGKTPVQLAWANEVVEATNGRVLILTPLAVAPQTIREAKKFDVPCIRSSGELSGRILVSNYERLHHFKPGDFAGVVCDESSILKSFEGVRRAEITEFMRTVPYRLLCTATAAPNDYTELGTSSEALGEMGHVDMLNRFFKNDNNTSDIKGHWRGFAAPRERVAQRWRFKGHAQQPFWRWVCTWARSMRRPSDLGFADEGFVLPPMTEREHVVIARTAAPGMLFAMPAATMHEEREERRRTLTERCETAAALVADTGAPAVIWCHLNAEGDALENMIPDAAQISGDDDDGRREELYEAFSSGALRVLIIKPKIGAWGLNWQHCAHVVTFASHSYEQYYQAVRRCWRFGQTRPVTVDVIASEGERGVKDNLRRKASAADKMFSALVEHMAGAARLEPGSAFSKPVEVPTWL